jgi:uncharacterized membrane protein YgdD (TMEM256/DUF423 family)
MPSSKVTIDAQLMRARSILILTAMSGLLAVLLGAFASHGLQLDGRQQGWLQLANQYHFYHTLALLAIAALLPANGWRTLVVWAWLAGMVLFCGSLYLAAMTPLTLFWLTPIGGMLLLGGWLALIIAVSKAVPRN